MPEIKIAPSILSADRNKLQQDVDSVKDGELLHVDIMDGKFVPPVTFSVDEIKRLKTSMPLDVHLMVAEPEKEFVDWYIEAGASIITVHIEATKKMDDIIAKLKKNKVKAGIAINPKTAVSAIKKYLGKIDMVVVMSVNPGYAGQKFISEVLPKVKELRKLKPKMDIEIDGGINAETVVSAVKAGANVIVAGNYVFSAKDRSKAIDGLKKKIKLKNS